MTTAMKEQIHKLIDTLPENATWEDLMYEMYVHESIEKGIADLEAGRSKTHEEVMKRYGL